MYRQENYTAIGIVTQRRLGILGRGIRDTRPIEPDARLDRLLAAIDRATQTPGGNA